MDSPDFHIHPVRPWDLLRLTQMAYDNMTGVDLEFTRFARNPLLHLLGYLVLPLYLLTSGKGYKAVMNGQIEGCAFLHIRRQSGLVYNVNVNRESRRLGIAGTLMQHVEGQVRRVGKPWIALQVDENNRPAQELYLKLGYRPYHPYYFVRENGRPPGLHPTPGLQLDPLSEREGRKLFRRYGELERREGDGWAADVVTRDYAENPIPGGRFWRVFLQGEEAGCIWCGPSARRPFFRLHLRPMLWGHLSLLAGLLHLLLQKSYSRPDTVSIHLGSSAHYVAATPLLQEMGFVPRRQARILMLKSLQDR